MRKSYPCLAWVSARERHRFKGENDRRFPPGKEGDEALKAEIENIRRSKVGGRARVTLPQTLPAKKGLDGRPEALPMSRFE